MCRYIIFFCRRIVYGNYFKLTYINVITEKSKQVVVSQRKRRKKQIEVKEDITIEKGLKNIYFESEDKTTISKINAKKKKKN